ncbi:proliferating cell nuclear antigen SCDLUD_000780 [Saccharomycodes ludwigii]|uniref:proliferating cell nuclear antigen n=1 Tax=Saccharomycodes ludwigii TaxID=36035 RepID=UPI001E8C67A4|nr:hypothetical protein SCDLUD_000780 [Saccharomycodes ludwigii]KAH3903166.1 hypothetical protein SCDLUD_000780 [Saccharomycodes ludwigii]
MLEAKFTEASLLKKIIDSFKDSVELVNFVCDENGIEAQAVDDSRVLLVALKIGADLFEEYRCDRGITLGLNLTSLAKILRCGNNTDNLTLIAEDEPDSLLILFEDVKKEKMSEYSLKLVNIDADMLKIDDMKYDCLVEMPSVEFAKTVRDLNQLSDSFTAIVTKDTIKFVADGEIGSGSVILKPNVNLDKPEDKIVVELEKPVDLTFSSKYLLDIVKASGLSMAITLKLAVDAPALFEFKLNNTNGFLSFFLAPKFNDEE